MLAGKLPVIIHADELRQITAAVAFAEQEKLKLIIAGGYDAPQCARLLKKHDVPVIVGGIYRLPRRRGDELRRGVSRCPPKLHRRGHPLLHLQPGPLRRDRTSATCPTTPRPPSAFGLPADEALKAITLYPAQILGVADRVGSLEVGKDATLFVADGDPLDTPTQVTAAWIRGRKVDLNDRHKRLYRKYEEKYKQLAP